MLTDYTKYPVMAEWHAPDGRRFTLYDMGEDARLVNHMPDGVAIPQWSFGGKHFNTRIQRAQRWIDRYLPDAVRMDEAALPAREVALASAIRLLEGYGHERDATILNEMLTELRSA